MASASSSAVSALAGGRLVEHSGWRAVFWVNVPIPVLAAALTLAGVPQSADTAGRRIDVPGATLVTAGLVLAVAGFARAVRHPWTGRWTLVLLIAAAVLLTAVSAQQLRAASPLAPVGWLAARGILVSVSTCCWRPSRCVTPSSWCRSTCRTSAATPPCRRACGCCR